MTYKHRCLFLLLISFFNSCIREDFEDFEDCVSQQKLILFVKDKAYFNEEINATENTYPFNRYISEVYYTLKNADNNTVINPLQYMKIKDNIPNPSVLLNNIPGGNHEFSVWGNLKNIDTPTYTLIHKDQQEDTDIYLANSTFKIRKNDAAEYKIGLQRVKGKLVINLTNLPSDIYRIDQIVTSVYETVSDKMAYSGEISVQKTFSNQTEEGLNKLETLLAPTIRNQTSKLSLSFHRKDNAVPLQFTKPIEVTIKRNEITNLKINYNSTEKNFEVWLLINSEWQLTNKLELT